MNLVGHRSCKAGKVDRNVVIAVLSSGGKTRTNTNVMKESVTLYLD